MISLISKNIPANTWQSSGAIQKMTFGTKYTNGDIVLIPVPFTNLKETKVRPAFVITQVHDDIIVCAITSVIKNHPYRIPIYELTNLFLPLHSQIHCTMIATLDNSLILKKIGKAQLQTRLDVNRVLQKLLNV